MHAKTKRRLTMLLVIALLVGGAGGGFVIYRKQRSARMYADLRRDGLAAYAAGDYNVALDKLGRYIGRFQTDSDALYDCAQARLKIQEPNREEIPPAISLLRRFLDLNPARNDVREQLLELYLKVGFFAETINASGQILSVNPKDPKALRAQAL